VNIFPTKICTQTIEQYKCWWPLQNLGWQGTSRGEIGITIFQYNMSNYYYYLLLRVLLLPQTPRLGSFRLSPCLLAVFKGPTSKGKKGKGRGRKGKRKSKGKGGQSCSLQLRTLEMAVEEGREERMARGCSFSGAVHKFLPLYTLNIIMSQHTHNIYFLLKTNLILSAVWPELYLSRWSGRLTP